ncbi:hypothetical protein FQZ97_1277080 [compost metagenome]
MRLVTDLPEPDSPTSAVVLPGWIEKLTSATERINPSSVGKLVLRLVTVRRGVVFAFVITRSSSASDRAGRAHHHPAAAATAP